MLNTLLLLILGFWSRAVICDCLRGYEIRVRRNVT